MGRFSTKTQSTALVPATPERVWAALADPHQLAHMTPLLQEVRKQGADHWVWEMNEIAVVGRSFSFTFTERMTFEEHRRIEFTHDPSAGVGKEIAGVEGWYDLTPRDGGTWLEASMEISVDLPFPGLARPAITTAMKGVVAMMGQRFGHHLLEHLESEAD